MLSGKQRYFIGNKFYDMHAGDIALIEKGVLHKTQKNIGGNRILLYFNHDFLEKYFSESSLKILLKFFEKKAIRLEHNQQLKAQTLMENIILAQKNDDEENIFYNLLQLFILLNNGAPLLTEDFSSDSTFAKLIEYVDKNFQTITCLEDVAKALFISKYHICHLFKTNLDITFNNYLLKIKLKEAKRLLLTTNYNVTKISMLLNFTNPAYFCYVFRTKMGISPTRYRKQNK